MIKTTPKTCNKEVQKFTNTSYDILLELYNNTQFFKDLYETLHPALYTDFSLGLGGWKATDGTGTLIHSGSYTYSTGGDFYIDGLDIKAEDNPIISLVFSQDNPEPFKGDLEVTYGQTVVIYEDVLTPTSGVTVSNIDLAQYASHVGTITGIRFILGLTPAAQFTLYKAVVGKPLVSLKELTIIEGQVINIQNQINNLVSVDANYESRLDSLEEKPVLIVDPDTLGVGPTEYKIDALSINGLEKNVVFENGVIKITNTSGASYLVYSTDDNVYKYKGILILPDGTTVSSIDDIRGESGSYSEMRFARSTAQPPLVNTDFNPSGWTIAPPVGNDPLWMTTATKKNDQLIVNWSTPILFTNGAANSVIASLTSDSYTAVTNTDGTNPNLTGAGGEFVLSDNGVKVTSGAVFSGGVTKNGLTLIINASTGLFNVTGSNWSTDVEFFDLQAAYKGQTYTKRYSVIKQKGGGSGGGTNVLTIQLYKSTVREATTLSIPSGPVTFNLSTLQLTEDVGDALNGWSVVLPENTLPKRWITQATVSTTESTVQIQPSQWSVPRVLSIDGVDGEDGSGTGTGLDGFSRATVYAYKAANSILSSDNPGDCIYTFATGTITLLNGWNNAIPDTALPVWVRSGLAISRDGLDTINSNEWSDAVQITGSSLNSAQIFIYKRTESNTPPTDKPTVSCNYDFATGLLTGQDNGWTAIPPLTTEKYLWIRAAMASSTTLTDNIEPSEWNEARLLSSNGSNGSGSASDTYPGAERKGGTYPNFNWNSTGADSATARWGTLAGRTPVAGDVFIQVNSSTGATEVRAYNGSAWAVPDAVYESLVTFGVLSGDQILAGSVINAPIIRGGSLELVGNSASQYMNISRNDPFGPNNLIEWFGPKVSGVTWNTSLNAPIYNGMTKANAVTYKGADGSWYTSGSILAGTLRNAVQNTTLAANTDVETGTFGSNGGVITIKCGFSASRGSGLVTGSCPLESNPTGTLYLDKWIGGSWQQVSSQAMIGEYNCADEGPEYIANWVLGGSFTYTDAEVSTANRQFRLRVSHNTPVLPNGVQRLSIITEE